MPLKQTECASALFFYFVETASDCDVLKFASWHLNFAFPKRTKIRLEPAIAVKTNIQDYEMSLLYLNYKKCKLKIN